MCPHVCYIWEKPGAWRWLVGGERCDLTVKGKTMIIFFFFVLNFFQLPTFSLNSFIKSTTIRFPCGTKPRIGCLLGSCGRGGVCPKEKKKDFFFFHHASSHTPHLRHLIQKIHYVAFLHYIKAQGCGVVCLTWKYLNFLFIIFPFL